MVIIAAMLWAVDGLLRRSLYGLPPSTLIFFEHMIGFILIIPFALRAYKKVSFTNKEKKSLVLVSFLS